MMARLVGIVLLLAMATPPVLAADAPPDSEPTSRYEYDSYVLAVLTERKIASCEAHAPKIYAAYAPQIAPWRAANLAMASRLSAAALRWKLPGDSSLDSILTDMTRSVEAEASSVPKAAEEVLCERLLRAGSASNYRLARP